MKYYSLSEKPDFIGVSDKVQLANTVGYTEPAWR